MPTPFHLGWAALLLALAGLAGWGRSHARPPSLLLQLALAAGVIAWVGGALLVVARDHEAGLEVEGYVIQAPSEAPFTRSLGSAEQADVLLGDGAADAVHAVVRFEEGRVELWNASRSRRVELDGREIHDLLLPVGTELTLGGASWRLVEVGARARFEGPTELRTGAGGARGFVARLPGLERLDAPLGWLLAGETLELRQDRPLPDEGPAARLVRRAGQLRLSFASAADRLDFPAEVARPGMRPVRPADAWTTLADGHRLVLGRSRFEVAVRADELRLMALGHPARLPEPGDAGLVFGRDPGVLAASRGDTVVLSALDPSGEVDFGASDGVAVDGRVELQPGQRAELPFAPGVRVLVRRAANGDPRTALAGLASSADQRAWQLFFALALAYLLLVGALPSAGLLHARSAGVLHGAAMLVGVGLLCLYRLSDPGDPLRAGWVHRQATLALLGLLAGFGAALWGAWSARRVAPRPGRLFAWLDGDAEHGGRARWLYLVALLALVAQLPFGETGIAVPGLGSVQPIELARSLLVLHLAWWTARALEEKRLRVKGDEGFVQRWSYMAHALPVLLVVVVCYGLRDISPILVFLAFLAVMYGLSLRRPSTRLWPPASWRDHVAFDGLVALGLCAVAAWFVLADPQGTAARRLAVWHDPWRSSTDAYQAVVALWTTASGGAFGLGWQGANGVLPPAVQDDFVLALLAARAGVASLMLVAATFAVLIFSGAAAQEAPGRVAVTRQDLERSGLLATAVLWMLAIQAVVVLGSATGGLPVMGQPLPFVALAGSHLLLFCLPAVAVVLGATRVRVPTRGVVPRRLRGEPTTSWWAIEPVSITSITANG